MLQAEKAIFFLQKFIELFNFFFIFYLIFFCVFCEISQLGAIHHLPSILILYDNRNRSTRLSPAMLDVFLGGGRWAAVGGLQYKKKYIKININLFIHFLNFILSIQGLAPRLEFHACCPCLLLYFFFAPIHKKKYI